MAVGQSATFIPSPSSSAPSVPDDRPHVLAPGQLECGDDLGAHAPLQNAQRAVLAVARRRHYLDVGVRPLGGRELLGEEGRLAHADVPAGAQVQEGVAHVEGVAADDAAAGVGDSIENIWLG